MRTFSVLGVLMIVAVVASSLVAQEPSLEKRVSDLEQEHNESSVGIALFLFGAICALWAQNTDRNAWLWFFLGLAFNAITMLVLLSKNARDRAVARAEATAKRRAGAARVSSQDAG